MPVRAVVLDIGESVLDDTRERLHRLDPATAPVVQRIYAEYIAGRGKFAIAEALTRDSLPLPVRE